MSRGRPMREKVLRVTQSPLNERIWFVDLACGHETKVVQNSRPQRREYECPECVYPAGSERDA